MPFSISLGSGDYPVLTSTMLQNNTKNIDYSRGLIPVDFQKYAALAAISDPTHITVGTGIRPVAGGVIVSLANNPDEFISGSDSVSKNITPDFGYSTLAAEAAASAPAVIPQSPSNVVAGSIPSLTVLQTIASNHGISLSSTGTIIQKVSAFAKKHPIATAAAVTAAALAGGYLVSRASRKGTKSYRRASKKRKSAKRKKSRR
jgi:hypothetical protein